MAGSITINCNKSRIAINTNAILYILMAGKMAEIHLSGGKVYETRMTLHELEGMLGGGFIKIHRGCIVSIRAIHDVTDTINLINGESLIYTRRKKKQIMDELLSGQKTMIHRFTEGSMPFAAGDYQSHYAAFEAMPFAFADIEMVFNDESHAVDWIFRYANPALAKLEKLSREQLIGHSFSSLFSNMNVKWLPAYERAALYGEVLEVIDYSPEIGVSLKVICFPTFKGHCGCMLFDINEIKLIQTSKDAPGVLLHYLGTAMKEEWHR